MLHTARCLGAVSDLTKCFCVGQEKTPDAAVHRDRTERKIGQVHPETHASSGMPRHTLAGFDTFSSWFRQRALGALVVNKKSELFIG